MKGNQSKNASVKNNTSILDFMSPSKNREAIEENSYAE